MRKIGVILAVLMTFGFHKVQAQVSIDSIKVFDRAPSVVDSIHLGFQHSGQEITSITMVSLNDVCATIYINMVFEGCDTTSINRVDTTLIVGYPSERAYIVFTWDTTSICSFPVAPVYTDSILWSTCFLTTNSLQILNTAMTLYPNPAQTTVMLDFLEQTELHSLELCDLQGRRVRVFGKKERQLSLIGIPKGLYFLKVRTTQGAFIEKLVIE